MLLTQSEPKTPAKSKVAVIGGGISGMGAALALSAFCDVTLFEARTRLGGHARTLMAGPNRDIPVDTGFMVFNHKNYPHLVDLFETLNVPVKRSNMTFAVSLDDGRFEYGLQNPKRLLADPKNAANPKFWRMIGDIFRFNRKARQYLERPDVTLGEMLADIGLSDAFRDRYLCPLAGAIWSTSSEDMMQFPAQTLIQFFDNHGLLGLDGPLWYTPDGGSIIYVDRLKQHLKKLNCAIKTSSSVSTVTRFDGHVQVLIDGQPPQHFDHVVFACHSDQAMRMIKNPTASERSIIGQIRYRKNDVILHCDPAQMPKRRACWSSWTYTGYSGDRTNNSFTYWMNLLQSIPQETPLFVTLNPQTPIEDRYIYDATVLSHPQYDLPAIEAQRRLPSIQGQNRSWFCGAYTRYGFHEDGLASGYAVAELMLNQQRQVA